MTRPSVVIVDTGVGNLFSITRAIEEVGGVPIITSDPAALSTAERVIIPGVGSFGSTMSKFTAEGISDALHGYASSGRPLLGICLGMQMLVSSGHEEGLTPGLNLISGDAIPLPAHSADGSPLRLPHIGWSRVRPAGAGVDLSWAGAVGPSVDMYFAHSFTVTTTDANAVVAAFTYGGHDFNAVIRQDNLLGVQFHPERSGPSGLRLLASFVAA